MVVVIGIQKQRSLLEGADSSPLVAIEPRLSEPNTAGRHRVIRQMPSSSNDCRPQEPQPNGAVTQSRPAQIVSTCIAASLNQPLTNPIAQKGNESGTGTSGPSGYTERLKGEAVPSQQQMSEERTGEPSGPSAPAVDKKAPASNGASGQALDGGVRSSFYALAPGSASSAGGSPYVNSCATSPGKASIEAFPSASWSSGASTPLKNSLRKGVQSADLRRKKRRSPSSSNRSTSFGKTQASSRRSTSSRSTPGRRSLSP